MARTKHDLAEYEDVCFVVMPFGRRLLGATEVDFDQIYEDVLKPAIEIAVRPEGGTLSARRTDKDFFSGDIDYEMFRYLEYSRLVVADITMSNPNVFWELGVRHHARESGTLILRQEGTKLPFDIKSIRAFPYAYQPTAQAEESRQFITRIVTETLERMQPDSPVRLLLGPQQTRSDEAERLTLEAENLLRSGRHLEAIELYRRLADRVEASALDHMRLGLLLKEQAIWPEAVRAFEAAVHAEDSYAEGWRELGIAQNKAAGPQRGADAVGESALCRAIELNSADFDAHASLGGVLKRAGRLNDSLKQYTLAVEHSNAHPYPLLNMLKLRATLEGKLTLSGSDRRALARAARLRREQADQDPPLDAPWSQFDMAEICLFVGDTDDALMYVEKGIDASRSEYPIETFHTSLTLLACLDEPFPGVHTLLAKFDE